MTQSTSHGVTYFDCSGTIDSPALALTSAQPVEPRQPLYVYRRKHTTRALTEWDPFRDAQGAAI